MRIVFVGGGTAGHVNPALSIASVMRDNLSDVHIDFIGTPRGIENVLVKKAGYNVYHIEACGLKRSLSPKNLLLPIKILNSVKQSKKLLSAIRPDIVIGTGGYVCYPVMRAAQQMRIKTALHESNAIPGLTVKMIAKKADCIMLNFEECTKYFRRKDNITVTGNPMPNTFIRQNREKCRQDLGISKDKIFVLSFGGSIGAEHLNDACLDVMSKMKDRNDLCFLHATGNRNYPECNKKAFELGIGKNARILPYIDDMWRVMAAADIVISRAGAMTLSELAISGKAAILVPSPYVTGNHQYKNAKALSDADAALIVEEKELCSGKLGEALLTLISSEKLRCKMASNIEKFAKKNANRDIFYTIMNVINK